MRRRTFAVLLLLGFGCGCARTEWENPLTMRPMTDAEQIAYVLSEVERGFETKRIYKVLAFLDPSFTDGEGHTVEQVREQISTLFKNYKRITITRVPPKLEIAGDQAKAVETLGFVAEPVNPVETPPLNFQGNLSVHLKKVKGEWVIVKAVRL